MNKKILIIAFAFPPFSGGSVQRNAKFSKYLKNHDWDIHVLTSANCSFTYQDSKMSKEVEHVNVTRIHTNLIYTKRNNVFQKVLSKIYRIVTYFFTDDIGWAPKAIYTGLRLVKEHNIPLVYASGNPFGTFIIGFFISLLTNAKLVVDYRDSWSFSEYYWSKSGMFRGLERLWEKLTLIHAAKIIVAKPKIKKELSALSPAIAAKIQVITNGYDHEDYLSVTKENNHQGIKIVFTGMIWQKAGHHSLLSFLNALKRFDNQNVSFHLYGQLDEYYEELFKTEKLDHLIQHHGYVDHDTAVQEQVNADILLLLIEAEKGLAESNTFSGIIPAKIFEYMASGNQILAIVPSPGFEASTISESKTGLIASPNNSEDIYQKLHQLIENKNNNSDHHYIEQFSRYNLTRRLNSELEELL